jgi:DNA polymerase-3 subunit gamma/tau
MATAAGFSEEDLTRYLNLSLELYKNLQYSLQPRLHLELGLIKLVQAGRLQSIEDALAGLGTQPVTQRAAAPRPEAFKMSPAPPPAVAKPVAVEGSAVAETAKPTGDLRRDLHDALRQEKLDFSADAIQHASVEEKGAELIIRASKMRLMSLKDPKLAGVASKLLGRPVRIRTEVDESVKAGPAIPAGQAAESKDEIRERALSHPGVKRFQELFPDAQVRTVRNLNE